MSRVFRLGDFFGITATQLILFQPEGFDRLLNCKYTAHVNERLFSLIKEIECLRKVMSVDDIRPDYEGMVDTFRQLEYLGLSGKSTTTLARGKMARFYKDSQSMSIEDLTSKYGDDTEDILQIMKDNTVIDVIKAFPVLKDDSVAHKIVNKLFNNTKEIEYYLNRCKAIYKEGQVGDRMVAGKSVKDILSLDMENVDSNTKCCYFVNSLCSSVSLCDNKYKLADAISELINNITVIMGEYESHEIVYSTENEIRNILTDVYSCITVERLNDMIGEDLSLEEYEEVFQRLDSCLIGGMGFNSEGMGEKLLESIGNEQTTVKFNGVTEHNDKLDSLLRIAYIDARSKQYMMGR